jgi:hypothetical protein
MKEVSVNFNGQALQYGYFWQDDVLNIQCCSGTYSVPCTGGPPSKPELHRLVMQVVSDGTLPSCSGQGR